MIEVSLTFPKLALGSHQIPWDLKILLHHGAACIPRKEVIDIIANGGLRDLQDERNFLVNTFHETITAQLNKGRSRALVICSLETLWRFYAWADKNYKTITEENVIEIFKAWAEYQIHRYQVKKDISAMHAYRQVTKIANLIAGALKIPGARPGAHLLLQTRVRRPGTKKSVLCTNADKQNLSKTFEFGHALKKICEKLDISTVRGSLPIFIEVYENKSMTVVGCLRDPYMDVESINNSTMRKNAEKARRPLKEGESLFDGYKRSVILNIRIESELLIFIAQTGMNSTQAANIQRENYRWQSNGNDLDVFRVYKGRRSGDAIFRCYKSYHEHFQKYLKWLDDVGFADHDNRLFPLQGRTIIRAANAKIRFYAITRAFKEIQMPFFGPQELRKTRVNWLLRRSHDLDLTSEQMAHDKEVLIRDYERPHHQAAVVEIIRFHKATDPTFAPPGPGICVDNNHNPMPVPNMAKEAPKPDCISPEGCLFCSKHRDVMNADYCWKLASHAKIKSLETNLYKPPTNQEIHPAYLVIERINQKLHAIASGSEVRATWVKDAQDSVRAGRYHPHWNGHIALLEVIV